MIKEIVCRQREYFYTGETLPIEFRLRQLKILYNCIEKYEAEILEALKKDLNKSNEEALITEYLGVLSELRLAIRSLKKWSRPEKAKTPLTLFPAKSYSIYDPYGVVLIMSPWNYPFLLSIDPLIGAISAGNCAVVKPSAYSPNTSSIIREIVEECFSENYCKVIEGGREENTELLNQKFDFIFFTGSTNVGKFVMQKASENLIPISLELGGKSPTIVDESADIDLTAKRLVFGKFINAGQTCVAPDYVFVHESKKEELVIKIREYIELFYPVIDGEIKNYPKIINEKHFDRLTNLYKNENVIIGGRSDRESLKIEPTVLDGVSFDAPIMQEEIFGPVLPIITYKSLEGVISFIRQRPKPLAMYIFSQDKKTQKKLLGELTFGGGCINDTILHVSTPYMGFGGVGESGMGSYHGKSSFEAFSHKKSIVDKGTRLDVPIRYRPYTKEKMSLLRKLYK